MAEYIDRDALQELETIMVDPEGFERSCVLSVDVRSAPAADVVEVVRCKECKKTDEGELAGRKFLFCTYPFAMKGDCMITDPNHFCSYGVRNN